MQTIQANEINNKINIKYSDFIEEFYRKYTPVKDGVYDTKHKNWHIAQGAAYGNTLKFYFGSEMLEKVIKEKNISLVAYKLRQDKITTKFFWLGMKLALNSKTN